MNGRPDHIAEYWNACRRFDVAELRARREALADRVKVWASILSEDAEAVEGEADIRPDMRERERKDSARMMALERLISWRLDNPAKEAPTYAELREPWRDNDPVMETRKCVVYLVRSSDPFPSVNSLLQEVSRRRGIGLQSAYRLLYKRYKTKGQSIPKTPEDLAAGIERDFKSARYERITAVHVNTYPAEDEEDVNE